MVGTVFVAVGNDFKVGISFFAVHDGKTEN